MTTPKPIFSDEVMLAAWKESHTSGAQITLWLADPAQLDVFRGMTVRKGNTAGQRLMCVLVEIGEDEKPVAKREEPAPAATPAAPERGPGSELGNILHRVGWFANPALWRALHERKIWTLGAHKLWIEAQPCDGPAIVSSPMISATNPLGQCFGDVVLHHCDTAETPAAGGRLQPDAPQKPPHWYGIPLCNACHAWAHGKSATRQDKRIMNMRAIAHASNQAKAAVKGALGVESLRDVHPRAFITFADRIGVRIPQAVRMLDQVTA